MRKIFLAVLLFSSACYSKTLIITDIDDTIKTSHVLDKLDSIANSLRTTIAFKGMSETYQEVLQNMDSEIIYVTNALDVLMHTSHHKFVKKNFPFGKVFLRSGSSSTFKYNTIKKYLLLNPSIDRLILVGDNGERDIEFYDQIAEEFESTIDIHTYIRIVYAPPTKTLPLAENQIGFVSPLELLADLTANGFIPLERYYSLAEEIATEVILAQKTNAKGPHYFPAWLNCKNFDPGFYPGLMSPIIEKGYEKVRSICQ